jgi:hypothetical protein
MTSFSVTSIKKAVLGRFCAVDNSAKVVSLVSIRTNQRHVQTPICVEKILHSITCIRPVDKATPSGRDLNKETCEALYGKVVVVYHSDALSLCLDAAQRTPNQC